MKENIQISNGSLQEKNGIWQATFYVNGKYKWRSTGIRIPTGKITSRAYRDAENAAIAKIPTIREKLIDELQNPVKKANKKKPVDQEITLVDLLDDWIRNVASDEVRAQTQLTYQRYADKRIYPFFRENYPDLKAADVNPWIMQSFVNHLKDAGLKTNSIRKYLVPLRNATAYGTTQQLLKMDPLVNYKFNPKRQTIDDKRAADSRKRTAYSKVNCIRLMQAIKSDAEAPVRIPIMLALKLGLRREEILGLRFGDINWEESYLDIKNTVTKVYEVIEEENTKSKASRRRLYLDDDMKEFLLSIKRQQDDYKSLLGSEYCETDHVYVRYDGKQYYPDTVNKQLKKFLKKHNLPPVGLHELRHTFCTFLISAGVDLKTVQDMMGHSDSRMTMELYAHVVEDNKKAASGAIGTYLAA